MLLLVFGQVIRRNSIFNHLAPLPNLALMPRPIKRKARPVRVAKGSDETWKAKKAKRDAANLEKLKSAMSKYDIDGSTALSKTEVLALHASQACNRE